MSDGELFALQAYLSVLGEDVLLGRTKEVRDRAEAWLSYVPQTFPHYTRHTVGHSEEIVRQLSKLLFHEEDPERPVISLSSIEAYLLLIAAYLHDSGMVVSDDEKAEILGSEPWHDWTSEGQPGFRRWAEVMEFRNGSNPVDDAVRHFLADLQTRFLIAEFIRRTHHFRSSEVIRQHGLMLGNPSLGDPMLARTISNVCIAHGLDPYELEDPERYPDRADIHGEAVNVRLVSILLRLGDLLDMTTDRACPLLLSAACPLPPESLAHWSQYQRIIHRLTAPDRIEVVGECLTQDEHRVLQDWCQWLVDETYHASRLLAQSQRHSGWSAPVATIGGPSATIVIRPAPAADYFPSRWQFELDPETVFERLIGDLYGSPHAFLRELIQNALEATRCRTYRELQTQGVKIPEYPSQLPEDLRNKHSVVIRLESRLVQNNLSGELEERQFLTISDDGIGMDRTDIEKYLLQVGRSFYVTPEFRRAYGFVPTSRFGVGFLSVFAASDHVVVETLRDTTEPEPIRLTLTGPRNYLLTERGSRAKSGTSVEVRLREPWIPGRVRELVRGWCKRVEFPIRVEDLDEVDEILAESASDFEETRPNVTQPDEALAVQAYPTGVPGLEGELYVFVRGHGADESWIDENWARSEYPKLHPLASAPTVPFSLICFGGIALTEGPNWRDSGSERLDIRRPISSEWLPLGRRLGPFERRSLEFPEIAQRWEEILTEHLRASRRASGGEGWVYKQHLAARFYSRTGEAFWRRLPGAIRIYDGMTAFAVTLEDVLALPRITVVTRVIPPWEGAIGTPVNDSAFVSALQAVEDGPTMTGSDIERLCHQHRLALFETRAPHGTRWVTEGYLGVDWSLNLPRSEIRGPHGAIALTSLASVEENLVGLEWIKTTDDVYAQLLVNSDHPFAGWLENQVRNASREPPAPLERLVSMLDHAVRYPGLGMDELQRFLNAWDESTEIEPPPPVQLASWQKGDGLISS